MDTLQDKIKLKYLGLTPDDVPANLPNRITPHGEDLDKHLLRVMRNPDNFWFTCRNIFNRQNGQPLDIYPFQNAILKELWYRPFPMLVGSRGMGKSFILGLYAVLRALFLQGRKIVITGSGFRQAKTVFNYAESIWNNSPVLQSIVAEEAVSGPSHGADRWVLTIGKSTIVALPLGDGTKIRGERANDILADEFACVDATTLVETKAGLIRIADYVNNRMSIPIMTGNGRDMEMHDGLVRTPLTDAYKVVTKGGYEFICSNKHEVKTTIGWKLGRELKKGDMIITPRTGYFPTEYVVKGNIWVKEDVAWIMGLLTAEGSINSKGSLSVHMTDKDCVDRFASACRSSFRDIRVCMYERDAYVDERGWSCKHSYTAMVNNNDLRENLVQLGLERATAVDKKVPWSILSSPKNAIVSFLSGLFEGDGSAFLWTDRKITNKFGIAYYSVSEQLCREVQVLLKKLGIFCTRQSRKSNLSDKPQWMLRVNGEYALKLQEMLDIPKWREMYKVAYRPETNRHRGVVWDKSRGKWKAETTIYGKKKYLGRFIGQDEAIAAIDFAERELEDYLAVKSVELLPEKRELYDFHIPEAHSFVGNGFLQHNSIPEEVFETVVAGFGVVNLEPTDKSYELARVNVFKEEGIWTDEMEEERRLTTVGNQIIISGTAYYQFNHFATYWKKWKTFIHSKGDRKILSEVFENGVDDNFDYRDYSVIRIPVELLPTGMMDDKLIARSRATQHTGTFQNEFGAVFSSDSNGFFKRSLVESCVVGRNKIVIPNVEGAEPVHFNATLTGNPSMKYIYGIDPASEHDRFSIVVLEIHETHRRIVYGWSTTREDFNRRIKSKMSAETEYYGYCARKIRDLMRVFPCEHIALDSQGGGFAIMEALHDEARMRTGERPVWPLSPTHQLATGSRYEEEYETQQGPHIIELVNFAKAEYTSYANHMMKKDFEDRVLLFPEYDTGLLGLAIEEDMRSKRVYDTFEDCMAEIEELKEELATITHGQRHPSMRDFWDTPEIKIAGSKKGRLRKDRYSALLMANAAARRMDRQVEHPDYTPYGGFVGKFDPYSTDYDEAADDPGFDRGMYAQAPDWFRKALHDDSSEGYGVVIRRSQ